MKKYTNAMIFTEGGRFRKGAFEVTDDGRFGRILVGGELPGGIDLGGAYVIPGLVDTHIHGAMGSDFCEASPEGLREMGRYLASVGVTSFAPASATVPYETLSAAYKNAVEYVDNKPADAAYLCAIHMEGPFFSYKKKGAQNPDYLREPDVAAYEKLQQDARGLITLVDVAPELPGAIEFIEKVSKTACVSLAHTDATYGQARAGIKAGATRVTHLFNAMSGLGHREPGVVGAAAEADNVWAELICDGHHVHPAAIRAAVKLFPGRIVLISDALCCLGMPEGEYELGGLRVIMKNRLARLVDGTIAGAATNLYDAMRNAVKFGMKKEDAILAATANPAKAAGAYGEIGSISEGKRADFVIASRALVRKQVVVGGREV